MSKARIIKFLVPALIGAIAGVILQAPITAAVEKVKEKL